jgi:hypothetical protein
MTYAKAIILPKHLISHAKLTSFEILKINQKIIEIYTSYMLHKYMLIYILKTKLPFRNVPLQGFFLQYLGREFIVLFSHMHVVYLALVNSPSPFPCTAPCPSPQQSSFCNQTFFGLDSAHVTFAFLSLFHLIWWSLVHPFSWKWHSFVLYGWVLVEYWFSSQVN